MGRPVSTSVAPRIGYCRVADGAQVAYATAGEGPALVLTPGWLSHVERLWTHPSAASTLARLSERHRFIWYDRIGGGLSDRSRVTTTHRTGQGLRETELLDVLGDRAKKRP